MKNLRIEYQIYVIIALIAKEINEYIRYQLLHLILKSVVISNLAYTYIYNCLSNFISIKIISCVEIIIIKDKN